MTTQQDDAAALWSERFRREREADWRRLDKLVATVEARGLRALGPGALAHLPSLHRAALSALGVARAVCLDRNLLEYLEALTARSHLCLYAPREKLRHALLRFLRRGFPATVRAAAPQLLVTAGVLALGFAIAFALCSRDLDEFYPYFVDAGRAQGRDPGASAHSLRETLFDRDSSDERLVLFAAGLWGHNSQVTLLAFAMAILGGLPGLFVVLVTGMELGAMSALFHLRGLAVEWWSWILPHGITELFAVVLGATAGMRLAGGLVFGGPEGRVAAMVGRGRDAGTLLLGAILLLSLAGLIEGVFRQSVQSLPIRYGLAGATATLWAVYFASVGRRAE